MAAVDARPSTLGKEQLDNLLTALSAAPVRPFLATLSRAARSRNRITAHVASECIKSSWSAFSRAVTQSFVVPASAEKFDDFGKDSSTH